MPKKPESDNRQNLPTRGVYQTHPAQKARISMIATPIGNLADLSDRAKESLKSVDELWCEDTRHTQALLNAIGASRGGLKRVDQHSEVSELRKMLARVQEEGQWIGVVSDAGTPGVSDPGAAISQLISDFPGIRLETIPGASAVTSWVAIAGVPGNSFTFQGFFPRAKPEAIELLNALKDSGVSETSIFFESPHRIKDTLELLKEWNQSLDFEPRFVFAKELSKLHETLFVGFGNEIIDKMLGQAFDERGEWVFGMILPKNYVKTKSQTDTWEVALECLIQAEISPKAATDVIIEKFSIAKNLAYKKALELQKKSK